MTRIGCPVGPSHLDGDVPVFLHPIIAQPEQAEPVAQVSDVAHGFAVMIMRLARRVKKLNPTDPIYDQAIDYITRKGYPCGSPLRATECVPSQDGDTGAFRSFDPTEAQIQAALDAMVADGETVFWHIAFGIDAEDEEARIIMVREIIRTAFVAAIAKEGK